VSADPANRADVPDLAATLAATVERDGGQARVGYCVARLDRDSTVRAHADSPMPTASAMKVYLAAALYAAAAKGAIALDERIEMRAEHRTLGSGVLKLLAPGLAPTLRDHARLMIAVSDNVSTNAIVRALGGPAAANAAVHALPVPLACTEIRDYVNFESLAPDAFAVSTPDDFCALLAALFHRRCTGSAELDDEIHWMLRRQQHRSMLPRHLPCNEFSEEFGFPELHRVGSKSGSTLGVRADVGIVETPHAAWAIAVQVQGDPSADFSVDHPHERLIAEMSRLVFAAWGAPGG
jgi:beta-lactamase class A